MPSVQMLAEVRILLEQVEERFASCAPEHSQASTRIRRSQALGLASAQLLVSNSSPQP